MGNENNLNVKTQDELDLERLHNEEQRIRQRIFEIQKEVKLIELKKLDLSKFQNKYIVYTEDGIEDYMYVKEILTDSIRYTNFDFHYVLIGYGFTGELSGYSDSTWLNWDYSSEIYLYGMMDEFGKKTGKIKIITKEEFDQKFLKLLKKIEEMHEEKMEKLEK